MKNLTLIFIFLINFMKLFTLLILVLLTGSHLQAQKLSFGISHSSAYSVQFKNPVGLHIGYTKPLGQRTEFNVGCMANYSYRPYDMMFQSDADPMEYFAASVKPSNFWLSLST